MSTGVHEYLEGLEPAIAEAARELRALLLAVDPRVTEEIKWNAPSFAIGEHFATMNVRPNGALLLVLHAGAKAKGVDLREQVTDDDGLLDWKSGERAILTFSEAEQVRSRSDQVGRILRAWISAIG